MEKYENLNENSAKKFKLKEIDENEIIKENNLLMSENTQKTSIICDKAKNMKNESLLFLENVNKLIIF